MAEATCPTCRMRLRLPDGKSGTVICPLSAGGCGTKFRHPPIEMSSVMFRCACDGGAFTVTFERNPASPRFTVSTVSTVRPAESLRCDSPESAQPEIKDLDQYDMSGFYCGRCGYVPRAQEPRFVRCSSCQSLVCGSQSYEKLDDPNSSVWWFVCYQACGREGPISPTLRDLPAVNGVRSELVPSGLLGGKPSALRLGSR